MQQSHQSGPGKGQTSAALALPVGTHNDVEALREMLESVARHVNLITPMSAIATLRPGYSVNVSAVKIDPDTDAYVPAGAKEPAIKGPALLRLAATAGVTWIPQQSGRLDDGSDPFYCRFRATGMVKDADGTVRIEPREKEIDLREGSSQRAKMIREAEARVRKGREQAEQDGRRYTGLTTEQEFQKALDQAGEHIAAMCESKAKNRAIRALLGIKGTMSKADLAKPFVALKPVYTGQYADPALTREAALMLTAHEAGMDVAALFGRGHPTHKPLGHETIDQRVPAQAAPPPVSGPRRLTPEEAAEMSDALDGADEAVESGERPFEQLDDDGQASFLAMLAERKGKLGSGQDQITEDWLRKQPAQRRLDIRARLEKLPDMQSDDPPFMR
jgi:hypothetical protein